MLDPIEIAVGIAGVTLASFWLTRLVRSFKRIKAEAIKGTKPWACPVCMSWWTSAISTATAFLIFQPEPAFLAVAIPAAGGTLFLLDHYSGVSAKKLELPPEV